MTSPQLDLFATQAAAPLQQLAPVLPHKPDRPHLADILPRRPTVAWERRLARAGDLPLELLVSAHWTGMVTEVLSLPDERIFCHADGVIQDGLPRDNRCYRSVFVSPAEARALGRRVPLLPCGRSAHLEARYVAGQGKRVIVWLSPQDFQPELMYLLCDRFVFGLASLVEAVSQPD